MTACCSRAPRPILPGTFEKKATLLCTRYTSRHRRQQSVRGPTMRSTPAASIAASSSAAFSDSLCRSIVAGCRHTGCDDHDVGTCERLREGLPVGERRDHDHLRPLRQVNYALGPGVNDCREGNSFRSAHPQDTLTKTTGSSHHRYMTRKTLRPIAGRRCHRGFYVAASRWPSSSLGWRRCSRRNHISNSLTMIVRQN